MKATFEDFLEEHPLCKKYTNNIDAIAVFDFLSEDKNIVRMIDISEAGKPALLGCLKELEKFYDGLNNPLFQFSDNFVRSTIGRMVATILAPFGYFPIAQVNFSQPNRGKYFGSANRYEKKGEARLRVMRTIDKVLVDKRQLEVFISELANNPLKREHLFVSAFLKIKVETDNTMIASLQGIEDKFKKLLSAKGDKKKNEKFAKMWEKLSFTAFSHSQPSSYYERVVEKYKESDLFPYGTIFEIFTDLRNNIDDVRATDVVDNYFSPAPYEKNLYGDKLCLRVSDFYYEILKKYENKFDYDECSKLCFLEQKNKSTDGED